MGGFHYSRNVLGKSNKHFWKLGIGNFKALIHGKRVANKNRSSLELGKVCDLSEEGGGISLFGVIAKPIAENGPFCDHHVEVSQGHLQSVFDAEDSYDFWDAKNQEGASLVRKVWDSCSPSTRQGLARETLIAMGRFHQNNAWRVRYPLSWISMEFCKSPIYMNHHEPSWVFSFWNDFQRRYFTLFPVSILRKSIDRWVV